MSEHYGSLNDLETHDEFIPRHIGPDDAHIAEMLRELGVGKASEAVEVKALDHRAQYRRIKEELIAIRAAL